MTSLTIQFNDLFTTTLWRYHEQLADNITSGSVLLQRLREKGVVLPARTGYYITEPLMYGLQSPLQWLAPYQPADLRPVQAVTVAFYPFRKAALAVAVAGEEVRANRTPAALMDLIRTKLQVLETSFKELFQQALVTPSPPTEAIHSLYQIVDNLAVVGNIDPSARTWWKSYVASNFGTMTWAKLSSAIINNLVFGSTPDMAPDLILVPPEVWAKLHDDLTPIQRAEADARARDVAYGFMTLYWRGIPIVAENLLKGSGTVFILNTNFLRLRYRPEMFFRASPMQYDERQDIHYSLTRFEGNLVTNNRRMHGKLTGVTTA